MASKSVLKKPHPVWPYIVALYIAVAWVTIAYQAGRKDNCRGNATSNFERDWVCGQGIETFITSAAWPLYWTYQTAVLVGKS